MQKLKIMVDTNVLISMYVFPSALMSIAFEVIFSNDVILSEYITSEFHNVINKKFSAKSDKAEEFLGRLKCTVIDTPDKDILGDISVRDVKDNLVLASAISADVDVLISGDRDFESVNIKRPEILKIAEFMNKYLPKGK